MATVTSLGFTLFANAKRLGRTLKETGDQFERMGQRARRTGESVGKGFSKLDGVLATAGAGAAASFGLALKNGIDAQAATGKLAAQLGTTAEQSKRIGEVAGKLYSQAYGEGMDDVRAAITSVVQNIDGMRTASQGALEQMTARAMTAATVLDEDVGGVTAAVSQMLRTGLAPDAKTAFDIITRGAQLGANKSQDLLDTLNEYGTQFRNMGMTGQQAMALIVQGLQAGARDADTVADTIKEFSIEAVQGGERVMEGFRSVGLDAEKMSAAFAKGGPGAAAALDTVLDRLRMIEDPVRRNQVAVELFGTKAEDMGQALFALDPSKAAKGLDGLAGSTDRAGKAIQDTAAKRFEAFKRSAETKIVQTTMDVIGWLQKHGTAAKFLAGAIGGLVGAYVLIRGATIAWTVAQTILNGVLLANPLGLLGLALAGLVAAIVIAYKKSDTFRAIVQGAWQGIKNAVSVVWAFIKPIFLQIAAILAQVWSSIRPIFMKFVHVLRVVIGTALKWYWAYVKFVFTTVWTIISTAWKLIKPVFSAIAKVIRAVVGRAFTVLWNVVKIVWIAIQLQIKAAWAIIRPIFNAVRAVIRNVLAPIFRWLWNNIIRPLWSKISSHISNVWNKGIKPAFDKIKSGVRAVRSAFSTAVEGIKKAWAKIKEHTKKPVNFVIGTVYNKGIVGLVNKVAGFAGIDTRLKEIKLLERGGTLGNPARVAPMKTRGAMAIVGEGRSLYPEYVIPTDPRFRDRALALWAAAGQDLAGRSAPGTRMGGEGMMFERGGIIGKFLGGLKSFAFDKPAEMFKSTVDKLIGQIPGSGVFRDAVAGIPQKFVSWLTTWFKDKVGFGGGKGVGKALAFAKAQAGKPYIWGGVGPRGYDCSGLWSAIVNVIKGRNPYSRRFTTFSFNGGMHGPEGFIRNLHSGVRVGVTNAGVGHMAGTLGRTPVESRGSRGVVVGAGARGAEDSLFTMRYGLKADTGAATLAPGWNPVYNGTGRPEYLETPRRGHDGPLVTIEKVEVHDRADVDLLADQLGFRMRAQAMT